MSTIRVHAGPGGRREAWRFSIRVWGEYALEPHGEWWHGDALPPDYRVRWQTAIHDDVARAVSPSDLQEAAARNVDGLFVDLHELLHVDSAEWRGEIAPIRELYASLGDSLPAELQDQLTAPDRRLS